MVSNKMVAKTIDGQEFIYSRESAHSVSERGANAICKALNDIRYKLKDNEKWHVYDCGWYERDYTGAGYQKFTRRNGRIFESRI